MKREDFEWLWALSSLNVTRLIPGPPDLLIAQEDWNEWQLAQIVHQPEVYFNVERPKCALAPKAFASRRNGYVFNTTTSTSAPLVIRTLLPTQDDKETIIGKMVLYGINKTMLAQYVARLWGLEFMLKDLTLPEQVVAEDGNHDIRVMQTETLQIGWKAPDTPVIILGESEELFHSHELMHIKEHLGTDKLHVIQVGETWLAYMDIKTLYQEGITYVGTSDFLTDDCKPKWDARLIANGAPDISPSGLLEKGFEYDDDYSSIVWRGTQYSLSTKQSEAMRLLHQAYLNRMPNVHEQKLLVSIQSKSKRLRDLFRKSLLWGTLIIQGQGKGKFRLNIP